jgi:hypothetical protein
MLRDTWSLHGEVVRQLLDGLLPVIAKQTQEFPPRWVGESSENRVDGIIHTSYPLFA